MSRAEHLDNRVDTEYSEWKDGLLTLPCVLCMMELHESEAVWTHGQLVHEKCAEERYG
jgi:hypothetical protein